MNSPDANQPSASGLQPDSAPFKADIVNNIPIHQAAAAPTPIKEGEDIDHIIQDVSHQLKKDDEKPPKRHFFSKPPKPVVQTQPAPQPAQGPAATVPLAAQPPKSKAQHSAPIAIIITTVIVTGILIAAAVSASK